MTVMGWLDNGSILGMCKLQVFSEAKFLIIGKLLNGLECREM